MNAGESIDRVRILAEHPRIGVEVLQLLRVFEGSAEPAEPTTGTLGDYRLLRAIGRGGMGVVYEAWEQSMERRVALKELPAGLAADDRTFHRFLREAKTAGRIRHPNVVPVYAMGVRQETPVNAMEFVEGETLAQILARLAARAPPATGLRQESLFESTEVDSIYCLRVAGAFAGAAEGLQKAHELGIVHRDLKPSNLILDRDGTLRILDFGLARVEGQQALTLSGDLVGTVLYMSPEQATVRRVAVDKRTDIYSLGATLHEVLARRPPFEGKDYRQTLSMIISEDPEPLARINPRIPRDLETIVLKCLRKDPADRYGTAEALAQDLRRVARGDPIEARPQAAWEKWARRAWRHRGRLLVAAVLVGLLAVGAALWLRLAEHTRMESAAAYDRAIAAASMKLLRGEWLLSQGALRTAQQELLLPRANRDRFDRLGRDSIAAAEDTLEQAIVAMPDRAEAHCLLARCRMLRRESARAVAEARLALVRDPGFPPARCLLGVLEGQEVPLDATIPWAFAWQRADAAMRGARWAEAADAYSELLRRAQAERQELYPGAAIENHFRRGIARLGAKDAPNAVLDFQAARTLLEASGEEPLEALLFLGKALHLSGQPGAAVAAFEEAQRSAGKQEETSLWIAGIYAAVAGDFSYEGRHEDAVAAARAATRFRPQDPVVWVGVGQALLAQIDARRRLGEGDRDASLASSLLRDLDEVSQTALRLGPESSVAHGFRARALDALGDRDGSRRAYRRALELDTRTQGDRNMNANMALASALAIGVGGGVTGQEGYFELEGPLLESCVNFGGLQWGVSLSRDGHSLFYGADGQDLDMYMASWDEESEQFSSCRPLTGLNSPAWDTGASASADKKNTLLRVDAPGGGAVCWRHLRGALG